MSQHHIVIVDLADRACHGDHHASLPALVRDSLSPAEVRIHVAHGLHHERLPSPDCVVLRPSHSVPLSDALHSLRRQWAQVPVLGLLCMQQSEGNVSTAFTCGLDDFLLCPFRRI